MPLKPCLQFPTETMQIDEIDPTVHVTETIGRTYYCVSGQFKNVSVGDSHIGNANEVFLPGSDHVGIYVAQFKVERFHGHAEHNGAWRASRIERTVGPPKK